MTRRRKANAAYVRKNADAFKTAGWTSVPNSIIRDPDIPPDEVWAWSWLSSHTDDFEVSGRKLYEAKTSLGRNRAYELLSALERRGLLLRYHAFDHEQQVPYLQYELQPEPVPEDQRTWEPPRAKPRQRGPHPGSKALRAVGQESASPVDNQVVAGQAGVPDRAGMPAGQLFPDRAGETGPSRTGGSRQAGSPYKEEKTMENINQPGPGSERSAERGAAAPGWLDEHPHPEPQAPAAPTPGVRFLASLPASCRPDRHAVDRLAPKVEALLAGGEFTADSLRRRLTAGIESAHSPAGALVRRIEGLALPKGTSAPGRPPWCGECDETTRMREKPDTGQPYRCPDCHPRCVAAPPAAS